MKTKTKKQDVNSVKNQEIKGKFVARDVKACFSYEMDAILKASSMGGKIDGLPTWDDVENWFEYRCPNCGEGFPTLEEMGDDDICSNCGKEHGEIESEPQEIFEWWIVTEWLYRKLKEKGCPVLEWGNNYYWGRCTTGQAILLDGVISSICSDMEILEGQKYDWSK